MPQSQLKARPLLQLHIKLHHKAPLLQGVPYHVLCTTSCKKSYINHRHLSCISKYTGKNTAQHAGGRSPPTLYSPFRFTEVYFNTGLPSMEYCTHPTASYSYTQSQSMQLCTRALSQICCNHEVLSRIYTKCAVQCTWQRLQREKSVDHARPTDWNPIAEHHLP